MRKKFASWNQQLSKKAWNVTFIIKLKINNLKYERQSLSQFDLHRYYSEIAINEVNFINSIEGETKKI